MKTEQIDINELHEDDRNAREHLPRNLKAIEASLKKWGQVEPLIVQTSSNKVIGGNGRLSVMKRLGWKTAEVHFVDLDDSSARMLAIALNRTAELAIWDENRLAQVLETAVMEDFDALGFTGDEIQSILDAHSFDDSDLVSDFSGSEEDGDRDAKPKIQYTIVFDNVEQQKRFQRLLKKLKKDSPHETVAGRLDLWIQKVGAR